jgi:hypothetical protein
MSAGLLSLSAEMIKSYVVLTSQHFRWAAGPTQCACLYLLSTGEIGHKFQSLQRRQLRRDEVHLLHGRELSWPARD